MCMQKKCIVVLLTVNKINNFRNIGYSKKTRERGEKKRMVATTDRLMAGIIQATQDIIQGLTVSAGALNIEPEIIFQLCFTSNHKTNHRTILQGNKNKCKMN